MNKPVSTNTEDHVILRRWTHVGLMLIIGAALTGLVVGVHDRVTPFHVTPTNDANADTQHEPPVPTAVGYAQMPLHHFGPNADWSTTLHPAQEDLTQYYDAQPADEASRAMRVAQRAERRAYSGAPPVVPHAIDQRNAASCLVCHGDGLRVGEVVAPRISHKVYENCTQCHVESTNRALPTTEALRVGTSEFIALSSPGPGERAWPGAPPTLPHATWMRENCASCHGTLVINSGLQTSHPWRTNCMQCHAPSAELDQIQWPTAGRPPLARLPEADR